MYPRTSSPYQSNHNIWQSSYIDDVDYINFKFHLEQKFYSDIQISNSNKIQDTIWKFFCNGTNKLCKFFYIFIYIFLLINLFFMFNIFL